MENKLRRLFEFQKIAANAHLDVLIEDTLSRYSGPIELTEEDMGMVAAGTGSLIDDSQKGRPEI